LATKKSGKTGRKQKAVSRRAPRKKAVSRRAPKKRVVSKPVVRDKAKLASRKPKLVRRKPKLARRKPGLTRRKSKPKVPPVPAFAFRSLDPIKKCGAGTSVEQLVRVDESVNGKKDVHLVFFDRRGWYCEHGRGCPAVREARRWLAGK
jgi:hypothetical protein